MKEIPQLYKSVALILIGPIVLAFSFFVLAPLLVYNMSCDAGQCAPVILLVLLAGAIISLVGIPKGIYEIIKTVKKEKQS